VEMLYRTLRIEVNFDSITVEWTSQWVRAHSQVPDGADRPGLDGSQPARSPNGGDNSQHSDGRIGLKSRIGAEFPSSGDPAPNASTYSLIADSAIVPPFPVTVASQLLEIEWFTCLLAGDMLRSSHWFQFRLSIVCKPPRV